MQLSCHSDFGVVFTSLVSAGLGTAFTLVPGEGQNMEVLLGLGSHLSPPVLSLPFCIFFPDAFWHMRRATSLRAWVPCGTTLQGSQSLPEVTSSW